MDLVNTSSRTWGRSEQLLRLGTEIKFFLPFDYKQSQTGFETSPFHFDEWDKEEPQHVITAH
jgi:hypothetical protein